MVLRFAAFLRQAKVLQCANALGHSALRRFASTFNNSTRHAVFHHVEMISLEPSCFGHEGLQ